MNSNNDMNEAEKKQYGTRGYSIVDLLIEGEVLDYRNKIDRLLVPQARDDSGPAGKRNSAFQHFGDEFTAFNHEPRHYYFHLMTNYGTQPLHKLMLNEKMRGLVESLLGEKLILNNFSLLAAEPGIDYTQGWHRDIIQIPENEIDDRIFSPGWHHNNTQFNLALYPDGCFWAVPGSHRRPDTPGEARAFGGSKHYSPIEADMPGGIRIPLKPGQAIFYNNNLIHRGYSVNLAEPRRTLHLGFHSALRPPTWHFYLLNAERFTPEYLDSLDPEIRSMIDEYLLLRGKYPRMEDTWPRPGRPLSDVLAR